MPVLIVLLFYIHDLVKIKRYYSQTEFVGQQMANILQNIAKTKQIKTSDVQYALSLAYLSIYPGTTMFTTKSGDQCHMLSHQPRVYIYCVKGLADGKASVVWAYWFRTKIVQKPVEIHHDKINSNLTSSVVNFGTNVAQSSIYPTLHVEEGKYKILLETQIRWATDQKDENGKAKNSAREAFGCRLVNPKKHADMAYFPSVIIFTPNSGLINNIGW